MTEIGTQAELNRSTALLDAEGNLVQVGWARQPLLDCNLENVRFYRVRPFQRFRVKRWDYYGVTTPACFFSVTLADLGYAGQAFVYLADLETGDYHEETLTIPLGRGISLPRNSSAGESRFDNGKNRLLFQVEPNGRRLSIHWPGFNGQGLSAELSLHLLPEHESMNIVIPIPGKRFYYNRKVNCIPAEGWIKHGDERVQVNPAESLANLDWGRGVWEYKSFWVWASASGFLADGRTVGLNLGFGFGDTSAATENALILDGRVHKLGQVDFTYDNENFKHPWQMASPDGRLELELAPFMERVATTNLLLITSEVHQIFGRYRGTVRTDDGESIHLDGLVGFAEEHHARW